MGRRFLTTTIKDQCRLWAEHTALLPGWRDEVLRTWRRRKNSSLLRDLYWACRLFRNSRKYPAVITGYEQPALLFGLLQRLLRRKKIPHIYLYIYPNPPRSKLLWWFKRHILRAVMKGASAVVVFTRVQTELYAQAFNVPESKFVWIPYYHTLWDATYKAEEGDYIFAGGDYTRDYVSFIEAVRPLPYQVVIAAFYRDYFKGIQLPANVKIVTTTHEDFVRLMAGAAIVVVPLRGGLLHSGGEQTYLNAMALGKAVIVADEIGAEQYIENGISGVVLPPGESEGLRNAIKMLMENRNLARQMGSKAKAAAARFSADQFFTKLLEVAEALVNG